MKKISENQNMRMFFIVLLIIDVLFIIIYYKILPEGFAADIRFQFLDFQARYKEGQYFLQHINPNLVVLGKVPEIPEIGNPGYEMTTFPVSYVLGQLLVPSFLPMWAAFVWMTGLTVVATVMAWKVLLRYCPTKNWLPVCLFLTFAVWNISGWSHGNYGMLLCDLVIISMGLVDRKPWLAGFLLAVASCKPQITMMFFFALLFSRKWKPMLIGGIITLAAFFFAGIWLKTSPLALCSQMSLIGERFLVPFRYMHTLGVANNLMYYTGSSGITQLVSAVICIVVMICVEVFFYRRRVQDNILLQWSLAAVLSSVCAYKYFQDLYVVVAFLLLLYVTSNDKKPVWIFMLIFSNRLIVMCAEMIIRPIIGERNYWIQLPTVLAGISIFLLCRIVKKHEHELQQNKVPECGSS